MPEPFRVAVTRDFLRPDGSLCYADIGLDLLESAGVKWEFLAEKSRELHAQQLRDYHALLLLGPRITAESLAGADRLTVIARFGVGYDNVDVDACSDHGVLLTITPDGVRRPVAVAAITLMLALSHKLLIKDRLTRAGRWAEKLDHMGMGVTGRTLGVIGLGNIGREICTLARPFEMRLIAFDPFAVPASAKAIGADLVSLETLCQLADFVCVSCALTPDTRHLINGDRLRLMKPTSYLINVARGSIVDQQSLTEALRERRIAGAGLDVFEQEPIDPHDPLLQLDNVIVSPHGLCWTDECFRGNGTSACRSIVAVAAGRVPAHVVNPAALDHPRLRSLLANAGQ